MIKYIVLIFLTSFSFAQSRKTFQASDQKAEPNYSLEKYWATLPFHQDNADFIPSDETWIHDSLKKVDVFYIYPTIYMSGKTWNADVDDKKLNHKIEKYPIKFHASVFNEVARVYTPRYRQAVIKSFRDKKGNGKLALDFAYEDVKKAFVYYMQNFNQGRPIIIASHSQGTYHARRLLKEFFDNEKMKKQLVCAYVIGFGIYPKDYEVLTPCKNPNETNCYVTWSTFKKGFNYTRKLELTGEICTNPICWTLDSLPQASKNGILLSIKSNKRYYSKAQIHNNMLWVKTKTPFVRYWTIMHLVDYNLFWYDIRKNVKLRVEEFERK